MYKVNVEICHIYRQVCFNEVYAVLSLSFSAFLMLFFAFFVNILILEKSMVLDLLVIRVFLMNCSKVKIDL